MALNKSRNRISIISRESNHKTLDVSMLEQELLNRGFEVTTLTRLLTKEKSLKSLGYVGHMMKQIAAIRRSDVVVVDTYIIPVSMLPHRRNQKVIQMWHALSAVKKFGWQTVGKEDGSSERTANLMKMHRGYDYVTCASDITAENFCEAFDVSRDKIIKLGLPRIDYIKNVTSGDGQKEKAEEIYSVYPQLRKSDETSKSGQVKDKKIILYAPTFHKGKPADVHGLYNALDPDKYTLIVKLHPIDREASEKIEADNIIYDTKFKSYDMLSVADAVISDYSSLVVESTLADIPLYIYAYDIDTYRKTTGLNIDFDSEPISEYVFRSAGELAETLGKQYDFEKLDAFRKRYIDIDTENCTARLADFIEAQL